MTRGIRTASTGALAVALLALGGAHLQSAPGTRYVVSSVSVTDLGTLGGAESVANDVNDRGEIVGWSLTADGLTHAFFVRGNTMWDLGEPGVQSSASGINRYSEVVGTSWTSAGRHATAWNAVGSWTLVDQVRTPPAGCQFGSVAAAVNDSGGIVGWVYMEPGPGGPVTCHRDSVAVQWGWLGAWPQVTVDDGGWDSFAFDINNAGASVGHDLDRYPRQAYRWQGGGAVDVPAPRVSPGTYWSDGRAYGINDHGWVVGSVWIGDSAGSRTVATFWDGVSSSSMLLGTLSSGSNSVARKINAQGFVAGSGDRAIVLPWFSLFRNRGFLWHRDFGMVELPALSGTAFPACEAMSLSGRNPSTGVVQIVGFCTVGTARHAVRWDVVVGLRSLFLSSIDSRLEESGRSETPAGFH